MDINGRQMRIVHLNGQTVGDGPTVIIHLDNPRIWRMEHMQFLQRRINYDNWNSDVLHEDSNGI